ncbi:NEL-type E3 ubiquitin ligase domain-containing protein [Pseudomonas sichuanensis]|uniref:NEL-type E3 ubiquitin ligase domain-containing protein n=1 Tax=Pseudomonas sichuanensis TaxID=2213015 RepID=UPI002448558C|nr:NEL-type E3 ubiquitin ligase domain-containing protein [Pseudomonas sichuanensis]MDH0731908.1 NEL-type E3 ubiquitin ligase domain-containing protein [Pseudomonas sichuanensis]MDH1584109.1 NEL-type E3 ubiquitin ligase domain-containing protein [Pseudomonas sichuanensis]MDH1593012.1 NEL-type E3 ubiquitin ligase domain-containing protein [Pseudomonas sichuanensis]MDH1598958.1 NEL-type E3 ubiquitin ligase domain-containing protein [Pseudomonas sichuanensis]
MTSSEILLQPPSAVAKITHATDDFIGAQLPAWLRQASPAQINRLRDRFNAHRQQLDRLRAATVELIPLQRFAQERMNTLLADRLPAGEGIERLQWLEVTPRIERMPGTGWPIYGPHYRRQAGLLRLMQNFPKDASFFDGSGLVAQGAFQVLSGDTQRLVADCRELDAGRHYQALLERVFNTPTQALLSDGKRAGLRLSIEIAALKGEITAFEQIALSEVADSNKALDTLGLRYGRGMLRVLGRSIADALIVEFNAGQGEERGLMLYLPSDPQRALRKYASWAHLNSALAEELRQPGFAQYFCQLVSLDERAAFLSQLAGRLQDPAPDLQPTRSDPAGDVFDSLVEQQVRRIKDDARRLLVPSAEADRAAAKARLDAWQTAGWTLLNLAGLFIPGVGELLLGQLVVQVLSEVYEGAADWYHGHQHEALEHLLGVAETIAVTGAVAGGAGIVARGFTRSAFVDELEPVRAEAGDRLWCSDLSVYRDYPEDTRLLDDGMHGAGARRWLRIDGHYYQVHRPMAHGPWRLRHPRRQQAFAPAVFHDGGRGWRLSHERALEWDDNARMLDRLWPQEQPLDARRAAQVLQVAGMDGDELRGLLVEGRTPPVNLRDTVRRFAAEARIERFFASLRAEAVPIEDPAIESWCLGQPEVAGLDEQALRQRLLDREAELRGPLLLHLSAVQSPDDALQTVIRRDFPGLPEAYVDTLAQQAEPPQRALAEAESRLPLSLAVKARSLLQSANLSRAVEGLFLDSSYSDGCGELVFSLLSRLPQWPSSVNIELRQGSESGRLIAIIDPQAAPQTRTTLVYGNGRFRLYDSQGRELERHVEAPGGIFQAIVALLTPTERARLGLTADDPARQLREALQRHLPTTPRGRLRLLGWREETPWFNPGRRLPDGRVGYLLSGRGEPAAAPGGILRSRLRALYQGLNDRQLDEELARLLQQEGTAFQLLTQLEDDYAQLDLYLERWVSAELSDAAKLVRSRFAERIRRAWRLQGEPVMSEDGQLFGQRLDLSNLRVRTLPALPPQVDFSRIVALTLCETPVSVVPVDFLRCFSALRELNMSDNNLLGVPPGIAYLPALRRLRLAHNNIRLDLAAVDTLAGLPTLEHLDLSYNPIGTLVMHYHQLPQLKVLNLRDCRLTAWPERIELCGFLERADLRNNRIESIPAVVLQMPLTYRRAYLVQGNPLRRADAQALFALDPIQEHLHLPEPTYRVEAARTRALWLAGAGDSSAQAAQWDRLVAMPDSDPLFELLGHLEYTADHAQARVHLGEQVWALLDSLAHLPELRPDVFARAAQPLTCENSVAGRFSELLVQAAIARAEDGSVAERGAELFSLGRGLYRLEHLDLLVRRDITRRLSIGRRVDQVAVDLAYRVRLRQRLALPYQPGNMLHAEVSQVSDAQVDEVGRRIVDEETPARLAEHLSQRPFWQRYLRGRHPQAFELLDQVYTAREAVLEQRRAELTSEAFALNLDTLRIEKASDVQALMLQLSREFLLGWERGHG